MSEFHWIEEHIDIENNREGWIYYFTNKFGHHPDGAEWFGLNNLKEIIRLREDMIGWNGSVKSEWNILEQIPNNATFIRRSDLSIITFEEYMSYIKIWEDNE
jgi:hypothetical protein